LPLGQWWHREPGKAYTWKTYGEDGVAIVSTYARLKSVLDALPAEDDTHLGLVRYGTKHLTPPLLDEVARVVRDAGHVIPVRESALARYSKFFPF
jgi:hypothetical protein